jgi:hypothetical protein
MVISGNSALKFIWKGDALWTKTIPVLENKDQQQQQADSSSDNNTSKNAWTTFVLPSRDPYPVPDWVTFGQFLAASLTFTKSLDTISVFVNDEAKLCIHKKWCMHQGSWWPHRIIAGNNNSNTILLREPGGNSHVGLGRCHRIRWFIPRHHHVVCFNWNELQLRNTQGILPFMNPFIKLQSQCTNKSPVVNKRIMTWRICVKIPD